MGGFSEYFLKRKLAVQGYKVGQGTATASDENRIKLYPFSLALVRGGGISEIQAAKAITVADGGWKGKNIAASLFSGSTSGSRSGSFKNKKLSFDKLEMVCFYLEPKYVDKERKG